MAQPAGEFIMAKTSLGALRGRKLSDGVRSFLGVPFAQAPVGALRFRPPEPPQPWSGMQDALAFAPEAAQSGARPISEDCLYLNIWTPADVSTADIKAAAGSYPVMVWFHGGGNIGGSTREPVFDGASFARSGVVCVTVAYRVGAFGFLELGGLLGPQYDGSGDNGLRDCVAALHWVRERIASFGGDPGRVTIFGQSAGAKNVAALMAMPEAEGLFQRAIMESGGGSTVQSVDGARDVAERLLAAMSLQPTPGDAAKLLAASSSDLLAAQDKMASDYPHAFPFRAVIGGASLPAAPVERIARGASKGVSLMIGTNRDDSRFFFPASDASKPIGAREIANVPLQTMTAQEQRYQAAFPTWPDLKLRTRALTAEEYWIPSIRVAEAHAAAGGETYLYRFEFASDLPEYRHFDGYAVHTSELPFVWNHLPAGASATDLRLAAMMHGAWVSFAATGAPAAPGLPEWPRYDSKQRETLVFGPRGGPSVVSDPAGDERRLWEGVHLSAPLRHLP